MNSTNKLHFYFNGHKMLAGMVKYDKQGKMTDEWFGYIDAANSFASEFPDGAYLAFMEEKGIEMSDLEAYSERQKNGRKT